MQDRKIQHCTVQYNTMTHITQKTYHTPGKPLYAKLQQKNDNNNNKNTSYTLLRYRNE